LAVSGALVFSTRGDRTVKVTICRDIHQSQRREAFPEQQLDLRAVSRQDIAKFVRFEMVGDNCVWTNGGAETHGRMGN
jgi:hypothetical protein